MWVNFLWNCRFPLDLLLLSKQAAASNRAVEIDVITGDFQKAVIQLIRRAHKRPDYVLLFIRQPGSYLGKRVLQ